MSIINEKHIRKDAVMQVAHKMMLAARTAPKGRGIDNLVQAVVTDEDIKQISNKMKELGQKHNQSFFIRDADNILNAQALLLFGTKIKPIELAKCGLCGYKNCEEKLKHINVPCAFNTGDLGIAIGSAVSIAMDNRIDNRIMYTVGLAVVELALLGDDVKIVYGIPLSVSSKNPFFDRK